MLRIIRRLADGGDWQNNFCKKLKIGPHDFDLFEAKLSKGMIGTIISITHHKLSQSIPN
jgi:hypothetical protein